ncbi:MAG: Lanthionine biosynthesis cyclase LanC [Myxococcales bacterium]|nr:Lanthionine biosynthesis cyclase LanC [Myxococcales bacterium]
MAEWRPVCEGALVDEIRAAILDIAAELRRTPFSDPSLTGGAGAAVFFSYAARAFGDETLARTSQALLDDAIGRAYDLSLPAGLYYGFSGLAWAIEHVAAARPDDEENAHSEVDDALYEALGVSPWAGSFDLVSGLVGIGVYALERSRSPVAMECARRIIDRLGELARPSRGGLAWWSDPAFTDARAGADGHYDLGLAHGVPGVIALLGRACTITDLRARAMPLLDGAVDWVLRNRTASGSISNFPYNAERAAPARTAWCYGDPGVAAALLIAARAVGNAAWERTAIEVARAAAVRAEDETGVVDAGLCHGAVGLAHLFSRFYHATGDAGFAEVARFWYGRALRFRIPGSGLAGFLARNPTPDGAMAWVPSSGFLTGVVGIGLGLISGIAPILPEWDRVLLCAIPARS